MCRKAGAGKEGNAMSPANHSRFALQIPALREELRVLSFQYQGSLSSPFLCELEVACLRRDLPLAELLGQAALLTLFDSHHPRQIHGQIAALEQGAVGRRFTRYRIILRPALWLLGLRSGLRIFQEQTTNAIVDRVLQQAGLGRQEVRWQITRQPAPREYCVQYRETDLAFISRLLAEEGWFYFFEHSVAGHTLVIADNNTVFHNIAGIAALPYRSRSGRLAGQESVYEFHALQALQGGAAARRDYGFEKPASKLDVTVAAAAYAELQHYDYPGTFTDNRQGQQQAQAWLQGQQARRQEYLACSDSVRLLEAARFQLQDHGNAACNMEYIIVATTLQGKQPQVLEEDAGAEGSSFECELRAIPASVAYRPLPASPRPPVAGVQTAFVTGPAGEEIYCDRLGRIKVQMHWDREGQRDENSSCWLRVSQAWAGNQWGSQLLPRVGQEVIVSFLDGNPDRPLVTGALYNAVAQAPYGLPGQRTRTSFKSCSSPAGKGYNELRIDDRKGSEQLFVHGQNDVELYVQAQRRERVDHDFHRLVQGALFEAVSGDGNHSTREDCNLSVGQTLSWQVGGNLQQKTGQDWLHQSACNFSMKAGSSLVLDAGMDLTLKAGAGTIALGPAGVAITGSQVRINSGGGAGAASAAAPTAPTQPATVTQGQAGAAVPSQQAGKSFRQQPVAFDQSTG